MTLTCYHIHEPIDRLVIIDINRYCMIQEDLNVVCGPLAYDIDKVISICIILYVSGTIIPRWSIVCTDATSI